GSGISLMDTLMKPPDRYMFTDGHSTMRVIREICGEILAHAGYSVDLTGSQACWDSLQRKKYELLIIDDDMPQVTGLELAVRVRGAGMELPIIIASAFVSFTADDTYAWLRFSSCLRKPFTPAMLLRAVEDVLRAGRI